MGYVIAVAGGCILAYLFAVAPLLLPRSRRVRSRPLRELLPGPSLTASERLLLLRVVIVAGVGVTIGLALDPLRGYWIVGAGIAVVGVVAERRAAFSRGLHRAVGTVVGAAAYLALALAHPAGIWLAVLLGVLQFGIEIVVMRNYALALVLITPLVLLLTSAATGEIGSTAIAGERVIDTLVGAALGAASAIVHPRTR